MSEYVETYDEPFHRRRFENEHARAYDVLIPPHGVTLYHRHTEDTLYTSVLPASPREQTLGEEPGPAFEIPAGIVVCRNHRTEPLIHQVTNTGDTPMRMIGVEVKASPPLVSKDPLALPHHELVWELERLRSYKLALGPGESAGEIEYPFSGITIALSQASLLVRDRGGSERTITCGAGDVVWHKGPLAQTIANVGESAYEAIVAEWR